MLRKLLNILCYEKLENIIINIYEKFAKPVSNNVVVYLLSEFALSIMWTRTHSRNDYSCTSSKINVRV